ncbi:MAG: hypothetical protein JWO39_1570 [Gemmatimonadetes bacterium]|nr:hypothetical protein [Gemmatimonadota bacterium]
MRRIADPTVRVSRRAGITIGLGLGGFVDGILLHQIAHWHNMGSSVLPPTTMDALERNMVWDGYFHAVTWLLTLIGVYMLHSDARRGLGIPSARAFTGQLITGWGIFNLIEGIIDHHILNLHHVRDLPIHVPVLDWLFLLVGGLGFIVLGWLLARPSPPHAPAPAL